MEPKLKSYRNSNPDLLTSPLHGKLTPKSELLSDNENPSKQELYNSTRREFNNLNNGIGEGMDIKCSPSTVVFKKEKVDTATDYNPCVELEEGVVVKLKNNPFSPERVSVNNLTNGKPVSRAQPEDNLCDSFLLSLKKSPMSAGHVSEQFGKVKGQVSATIGDLCNEGILNLKKYPFSPDRTFERNFSEVKDVGNSTEYPEHFKVAKVKEQLSSPERLENSETLYLAKVKEQLNSPENPERFRRLSSHAKDKELVASSEQVKERFSSPERSDNGQTLFRAKLKEQLNSPENPESFRPSSNCLEIKEINASSEPLKNASASNFESVSNLQNDRVENSSASKRSQESSNLENVKEKACSRENPQNGPVENLSMSKRTWESSNLENAEEKTCSPEHPQNGPVENLSVSKRIQESANLANVKEKACSRECPQNSRVENLSVSKRARESSNLENVREACSQEHPQNGGVENSSESKRTWELSNLENAKEKACTPERFQDGGVENSSVAKRTQDSSKSSPGLALLCKKLCLRLTPLSDLEVQKYTAGNWLRVRDGSNSAQRQLRKHRKQKCPAKVSGYQSDVLDKRSSEDEWEPEEEAGQCTTRRESHKNKKKTPKENGTGDEPEHQNGNHDDACPNIQKEFTCLLCLEEFETPSILDEHYHNFHNLECPYKCLHCRHQTTSYSNLQTHLDLCKNVKRVKENKNEELIVFTLDKIPIHRTKDRSFKCKIFSQLGPELTHVKNYMIVYDELFFCKLCDFTCGKKAEVDAHRFDVHNSRNPCLCNVCGKCFQSEWKLQQHLRAHSNDRPFKCDKCELSFFGKQYLREHIKVMHCRDTVYTCDICGKGFPVLAYLGKHKKTHSDLKPFKCDLCDKSFKVAAHLKCHVRMHSGEKPFECKECGKRFKQICGLTAHQRVHTGEKPYVCDKCSRSFMYNSAVKNGLCTQCRPSQEKRKRKKRKRVDDDDSDFTE